MVRLLVLLAVWNGIAAWATAYARYHVVDLSDLAAGSTIIPSVGYGINDAGMITGHGQPTADGSTSKVFFYNPAAGIFTNAGNLAGNFVEGNGGNGYSINQQGVIVGRNSISNTSWLYRPFLFYDANGNGIADSGEMQNLGPEADFTSGVANDINDSNQVVAYSTDTNSATVGWVWTDRDHDLQYDEGEKQYFSGMTPMSINNSGQIVLTGSGQSFLWNDPDGDGVYLESDKQTLPVPATYQSISSTLINEHGGISGSVRNINSKTNGLYWEDTNQDGVVDAEEYTLFGAAMTNTFVRTMNNHGQLAGGTLDYGSQRVAYIWTKEQGMVNLNDVAAYTHATLGPASFSQAEAINNQGVIVSTGWFDINHDGKKGSSDPEHVFVLIPISSGDIDMDGSVDLDDFELLSAQFGRVDCSSGNAFCDGADITQNGTVNLDDFTPIVEDWLITPIF
ncbi:MAG TPA: hypothetical protein PKB02_14500 [Anaerohalosphaeraceae bacterium]|nr:hypothetical protein [Anaerohalosphaeraceae bacterium]